MKKITSPTMATTPSYVGMPVSARTSAPAMACAPQGSAALVPTDWFDEAGRVFGHRGLAVGDTTADLGLIGTTNPGTRAWRPPS